MSDGLNRYLGVASGLTRTTLGVTERAVAQFVRHGEVAAEHAERLLDDVVARSVQGSGAVAQVVRQEVERAITRAGFVRREEFEALRREVGALRAQAVGDGHEATARDGDAPAGDDVAATDAGLTS